MISTTTDTRPEPWTEIDPDTAPAGWDQCSCGRVGPRSGLTVMRRATDPDDEDETCCPACERFWIPDNDH